MKAWRGTVRVSASLAASFALLASLAATATAACPAPPAGASVMADGSVQAAWQVEAGAIAVGRPFAIIVLLCPADAQLLRVDASMPEHRHGMNYRSSLKPLGDGRWRVEGLLWHMAGRWELRLDLQSLGLEHRLRQSVLLQ